MTTSKRYKSASGSKRLNSKLRAKSACPPKGHTWVPSWMVAATQERARSAGNMLPMACCARSYAHSPPCAHCVRPRARVQQACRSLSGHVQDASTGLCQCCSRAHTQEWFDGLATKRTGTQTHMRSAHPRGGKGGPVKQRRPTCPSQCPCILHSSETSLVRLRCTWMQQS